ncbi:hypothetical protein Q7689_06685 [Nocardiopsis tropica]|uniref:hypothetical protein n=1 Tax=Nocardiopsis tropica TaxID=109330 RepID=UPI002E855B77|nr:hypothetical protein [Nocardiopsis tropica]
MNEHDTFTTTNTAEPGSFVGAQVGQMHNSNVYVLNPDDPPEREYMVGRQYLNDGIPRKARKHIERARAQGVDDSEVRFHWVLAILSKRSYRDLAKEERALLADLSARTGPGGRNGWRKGLNVVFALLSCVDGSGGDSDAAMDQLRSLPEPQHGLVLRHLELVLTGSMRQGVWHQLRENAAEAQGAGERINRVWAYFAPKPAEARARYPAPKSTSGWDALRGLVLAGVFLFAVATMMKSALAQGSLLALVSCLAVFVFGPVAGWHVTLWNHQHRRRMAKEREYGYLFSSPPPPKGGFTDQVTHDFDHYFAKYAPATKSRSTWLEQTKGVRRSLCDEVARTYRETGIETDRVRWLIRFMVRDVRRRWLTDQPLEPHELHKVDTATKIRCVILCLLLAAATVSTVTTAFQQAPVAAVGSALLTVIAGWFAIPLWMKIYSEHRRYDEELQERKEILGTRQDEYARWKGKLDDLRPTETEMEAWLDADKTLLLDETLKHYRLAWHEVTTHAFLTTAKRPCKSAHVPRGPWRHSKYEIRVFLVTDEGVREAIAVLDFEQAQWRTNSRINYRFDAVSSVQIEIVSARSYTLNITLTNGPTKSIIVPEAPTHDAVDEESRDEASMINLDAAGFSHTLRILEGMAAEGKPWFERATDPPPAFASEASEPDAASDAGAASPVRNGTARRERSTQPLPDRVAPVP